MDYCLVIVIEHIQAMIHVMTIFVLLLFSDINYFAVLSFALRQVDDLLGLHYSELPGRKAWHYRCCFIDHLVAHA